MRKNSLLAFLLVFAVALFSYGETSATSTIYVYVVKAGDTFLKIAKKNEVKLASLRAVNPQIKNIERIMPGQIINLPSVKNAKNKRQYIKAGVNNSESKGKKLAEWLPGSAPTKATPYYAIQALPSFQSLTVEQKRIIFQKIIYEDYQLVTIQSGTPVYEMTYTDKSGRTQVIKNRRANLSKTGPLKAEAYSDPAVPIIFTRVLYCNNMSYMGISLPTKSVEEKKADVVVVTTPPTATTIEEGALPAIFVSESVEKSCVTAGNELSGGTGVWTSKDGDVRGAWWYVDYERYLRSCQNAIQIFGGTLTPIIGAFARGDIGKSDSGYGWDSAGIGPQAGAMWNGTTSAGYPHQVKMMLRAIYQYAHGANDNSGYSKQEQHALIGTYIEYLRRFHPEYMYILYSEGWFDIFRNINSTWSGDRATDITSVNIGAKIHKDLNADWAVRLGAQLGFQPEETRVGGNVNLELRYNDWLIFGPTIDVGIASDIPAEIGGIAYGAFVRAEFRNEVRESYSETYTKEVTPSDRELLEY